MVRFSNLARAWPLALLACSAHTQPRDHGNPAHSQPDRPRAVHPQNQDALDRPRQGAQDDRAMPAQGHSDGAAHRGSYFTPDHHDRAREYFDMPEHRGFVPPGLVRIGGMRPGQAKKWRIGQPLPREVVFYDLPRPLEIHLGPPPHGYRYVRVATDILLIAVGTGLVIDALENLAR